MLSSHGWTHGQNWRHINSPDSLGHISVCTVDSIQGHELLISFTDNPQRFHPEVFQFLQSVYGPGPLNVTYSVPCSEILFWLWVKTKSFTAMPMRNTPLCMWIKQQYWMVSLDPLTHLTVMPNIVSNYTILLQPTLSLYYITISLQNNPHWNPTNF